MAALLKTALAFLVPADAVLEVGPAQEVGEGGGPDVDVAVDIDIHLLSDVDVAACLQRGDRELTADLPPGTYVFALDSYDRGFAEMASRPCDFWGLTSAERVATRPARRGTRRGGSA